MENYGLLQPFIFVLLINTRCQEGQTGWKQSNNLATENT